MNKHILIYIILSLLMGFLYFLMYRNLNLQIKKERKEKVLNLQHHELLINSWFETLVNKEKEINEEITLLEGEHKVTLEDLCDRRTLVVRISYNSCHPCVERELKNLSLFLKKGFHAVIFASYPNRRSLDLLLKQHDIEAKAYLLPPNQQLFSFDETSSLYLFVMEKECKTQYLFFPIPYENEMSDLYFKFIENILGHE